MTTHGPTAPPSWLADFIGVPYRAGGFTLDGWACWGPVYEAYRRRGIVLPTYSEQASVTDVDQAEILALLTRDGWKWREIPLGEARLWDVLTFRVNGKWHCGLVLAAPYFLHCMETVKTTRERWDSTLWRHTLTGAFRWVGGAR